jgi:hypothetical protein
MAQHRKEMVKTNIPLGQQSSASEVSGSHSGAVTD